MQGASRESLAQLRELLPDQPAEQERSLASELLALVALLDREFSLRAALSDPGVEPEARAGLAARLLSGRISEQSLGLVQAAARARWSKSRDLVDALETVGALAALDAAERSGTIDRVEEELFRFGRIVLGNARLRLALDDPNVEPAAKRALVDDLLRERVDATTQMLVDHLVTAPSGRRIDEALDSLVNLAADRRREVQAEVTVPVALSPEQEQRLAETLGRIYRADVRVHVHVDTAIVGGARISVADEVFDGTVATKIEQARRLFQP